MKYRSIQSDDSEDPVPPESSDRLTGVEPDSPDAAASAVARTANIFWATMAGALTIAVLLMFSSGIDSLARGLLRYFEPAVSGPRGSAVNTAEAPGRVSGYFSFEELDIHPDVTFRPYTAGQLIGTDVSSATGRMIRDFRTLLDLYEERQGIDDNFTIRVVDNRTNEMLEVYELEDERRSYESRTDGAGWDWGRIDRERRRLTNRLVDKYAAQGIPRGAVTVKWGRKNQVLEARERELGYIEYEIRLARALGMSLLVTEIGTVETFNQDRLVSPVGARSRYQMMPYVLRQNNVYHYKLATAAGNAVDVYEEWHPLLTMEPSFVTAAGYRNAVGHEIPGISAYHTGPGNIYTVYRMFLTAGSDLFTPESTVMDAYMWAVTTGYETVSRNSSFKTYSRGYVASAYGALRATQSLPIDSTLTIEAERLQLRPGEEIYLSRLLGALERSEHDLNWGPGTEDLSLYNRFRSLNEHIVLPAGPQDGAGLSPATDLRIVAEAQGVPVRFFLPLGASDILAEADVDVMDEEKTFVFTHDTYGAPNPDEVTTWDRQYDELVRDVAHFGFTNENRRRLGVLVDQFEDLAATRPSHFRRMQLEIIKTHERIWGSNVFDKLASAVSAARGSARFEPRPPSALPSRSFRVPN